MRTLRYIRWTAGVVCLLTSISAMVGFGLWQQNLGGLSPDGSVLEYTWLTLRILLLSLFVPGLLLLFWEHCNSLIVRTQRYLDRLSLRAFLWGTLGVAAVLRILVVIFRPPLLFLDWEFYHRLALLWATMGEYTNGLYQTAYFPPGWPFFLSRLYLIFGPNPYAGVIANIVLSVASVYLAYRLVHLVWGDTPARWTALIMAVFPGQILFVKLLCSEILFTFLFLLSLNLVLGRPVSRAKGAARSFFSGFVLGLATLVRSLGLAYPLVLVPYFFGRPLRKSTAALHWLVLAIGLTVVTGPWIMRNYDRVGRATISTNGGVNFYIGNNPGSGVGYVTPDPSVMDLQDASKEAYYDRLGYRLGWQYISEKPARFLIRGIAHIAYMITSDTEGLRAEVHRAANEGRLSAWFWGAVLTQTFYFLFLLLVAAGIVKFLRYPALRNPGGWLFILTIVYWLAVHFVFFGEGRFHFPIVPLLAGFAALQLAGAARRQAY